MTLAIAIVLSFIAGFISNRLFSRNLAKKWIKHHLETNNGAFTTGYHQGWDDACKDVTTVKASYERIFGNLPSDK